MAFQFEEFIKDLSEEELFYLNRLIVERLKLMSQARSTFETAKFNIGEIVEFEYNDGNTITGRVIKLNKKTVSVLTDTRQRWNVAPVYLRTLRLSPLIIITGYCRCNHNTFKFPWAEQFHASLSDRPEW